MRPDWVTVQRGVFPQATNRVCLLTSTAMAEVEAKQLIHSHESSSQNTRTAMEQWMMDGCSQRDIRETQSRLWRHTPERASWRMASPAPHRREGLANLRKRSPFRMWKFLLGMDGWRASICNGEGPGRARTGPMYSGSAFHSISQFWYGTVWYVLCTVRCGVAQG